MAAVAGTPGIEIDGYRDYRGVPVVGAWQWLPKYDLGLITEVDHAEAYRPLTILQWAFFSMFGLLAVSSVAIFVFTLVVAEAMSCGLPVLVSDRGSLPELVVPAAGGLLADPSDRSAFVRGILTLLGDPAIRRRFGTANRERVERLFRWDVCAAATARVYEEVLEAWRARGRRR